jgi:hypothetical protein
MREVMQQVAVEQVLALLLQTHRRIDFRLRLARHDGAQELDVGRGHFHVHEEVRVREAEDDEQLLTLEQHGIEREHAGLRVADGHGERQHDFAVDDAPDDVSRLVAEEQRREHVNLEVRGFFEFAERVVNGLHQATDVAREVFERRLQLEVRDDALERGGEPVLAGVVGAVGGLRGGFVVLDVLRRDGGPHENEVVVEIRAVQDLAADRIEERLGALRLLVAREQADVVELDLLPDFVVDVLGVVFVFEQLDAFFHALVIRRDALARETLQAMPVAGFEQLFCTDGCVAEDPVVPIEAFEHGLREVETDLRRQQFGKVIHVDRACSMS